MRRSSPSTATMGDLPLVKLIRNFLKRCMTFFPASMNDAVVGAAVDVADVIRDDERISRFLYDESKVRAGKIIKHRELMPPNKGDGNVTKQTSVCRTDG